MEGDFSPQSQLTENSTKDTGDIQQSSKLNESSTSKTIDSNNDDNSTSMDHDDEHLTSKDDTPLSPNVSDKEHLHDDITQRSDTNTPLLDDTDCNNDDDNMAHRNENETPISDADHDEPNRSESVITEQDDNNSSILDENAISQQSAVSNENDNDDDDNIKTETSDKTSNFHEDSNFGGDLNKFPDQILAETSATATTTTTSPLQDKDKEKNTDFEEININESEKEKSSHTEETDALGEDRTQIISRSPRDDSNKEKDNTTAMDIDQNDENSNLNQSFENRNLSTDDIEMRSVDDDDNNKTDGKKNKKNVEEVTVEKDNEESTEISNENTSEKGAEDVSTLQCDEQLEEGQVIEAAPNESENICLLPDEEKELTGAEKERALQAREQAEKEAEEAKATKTAEEKTVEKEKGEKNNEQQGKDGTRVSTPTDEINLDEDEPEHEQTETETNDTIQHGNDNETTDESNSITKPKNNEIKELTDENITEQKCCRCNKMKLANYKLIKDGDVQYLCDIKCVNAFRTLYSKENYTLICRRISISQIIEKFETCEKCKMKKTCYFRFKMNPTNENYQYLCENSCLNEFIGKNKEKYWLRKKRFLVEELSKNIEDVCIHCKEKKSCKYYFLQDQEIYYICGDACFYLLLKEEPDHYKIRKRTVRVRDLGGDQLSSTQNQIDNEPKIISRSQAEVQAAKLDRDASFIRRCGQCYKSIDNNEITLHWETLDFCNEICLGKYQNAIGSRCQSCHGAVPVPSLGKYCVRFGFEVRQFCCSSCLDCFKKGLKVCSLCQKDISQNKEGFLAPVGDKGQFKDFCTQNCLKRYEELHNNKKKTFIAQCSVCNINKQALFEVNLDDRTHYFCSNPCFSAFKFVNNIFPDQCTMCMKFFERKSAFSFTIYQDKTAKVFCCKICMNLFITMNRKIVPCQWCKVKKYNFDMIQKQCGPQTLMLCSLNCLTLYGVSLNAISMRQQKCDQCGRQATPQYHLTMSDATIRNFCTYQCVMVFQSQFGRTPLTLESVAEKEADTQSGSPFPTSLPKRIKQNVTSGTVQLPQTTKSSNTDSSPSMVPVISNVESLASHVIDTNTTIPNTTMKRTIRKSRNRGKSDSTNTDSFESDFRVGLSVNSSTQTKPPARRTVGTVTLDKGLIETKTKVITVPPLPRGTHNRMTMCKPNSLNKAVSCRPNSVSVQCQTEKNMYEKVIVPVPIPIYVPQPMYMYSAPFPVPVPIPLPIPVPIFIPTTRNSSAGILKEIKKIQDKMPSNPYEADLLMMAEMVAGEKKKEESDSDDDTTGINNDDDFVTESVEPSNSFGEDMLQMALKMATEYEEPAVDLESAMATNTITPSVHPHLQDDDMNTHQMIMIDGQRQLVRGRKRVLPMDGSIQQTTPRNNRLQTVPPQKKRREIQQQQHAMNQQQIIEPVKQEPVEKPDANMCLKYTFGVNAWKQWVMTKNADLEKSSIKRRPFKSELLQMTADELNYSLCLFVKEVRKPNGSEYAPDTIYYLVLGIQQYLYENGRIDNIFTDPYYERFTDCLDEVAKKFSILYNDSQYIVTRVEEEHLWECKQLGAHSPHVLLSTLMFFNTKHFNLTTVEEHMQLSFSHIMKHWKRSTPGNKTPGARNVLLRFYPPQTTTDNNPRKKKVYEQQENEDNPLRCPVKLYEFYLSKCPESVKTRNDVFYLQPERSCVPDSPVWYSTQPLSREALSKMLHRVKMVKEINIALLTS